MKKDVNEKKKGNRIIALTLAQKELEQVEGGHVIRQPFGGTCTNNVDCD